MSLSGRTATLTPMATISDVPNSLLSKREMKAMPSRNQVIQLTAQNGSSQNANGTISFQLPSGSSAGYLKSGSMYLNFSFTPTSTANTSFNGTNASCSAIIRSMNVNIGGVQVEMVSDYGYYYRIIQDHATNANYVERDCSITEKGTGMVSGTTYNFCVPLIIGAFNNETHFPLWLLNSPIQVQLNLTSAAEALNAGAGQSASAYVVQDPMLIYERIYTDESFNNAVRAKLAEGSLYELPFYSAQCYRTTASAGTFSQNIGVNLSSLSSVLWGHVLTADVTDSASAKNFVTNNSNTKASGSNRVVRCDGEQLVSTQIWNGKLAFQELQRSLGSLSDVNQTTVANSSNWETEYFINGHSAERFNDAQNCLRGRGVNNIVVEENAVSAGSVVFMYLIYSGVLMIGADGSVVVSK